MVSKRSSCTRVLTLFAVMSPTSVHGFDKHIGEFGQEVLSCSCRGHWVSQGHCGYHFVFPFTKVEGPWCRTKYKCGNASLLGSWMYCDELSVERRLANDGKLYNVQEFKEAYGSDGIAHWVAASQYNEKRVASDGAAYGVHEFRGYHIDSLGEHGWLKAWVVADPERRVADDAKHYTWNEFVEFYGLSKAWSKWDSAKRIGTASTIANETKAFGGTSQAVQETVATLRMLSANVYPNARCLDGTGAGYYLRKGTKSKYLIFLEGGGWCYDQDCRNPTREGTLRDCRARSHGRLGSSKSWARTKDAYHLTGMLSSDRAENPVFHDWTLVYLPYCDGASFSGSVVVDGLHFQGKAILEGVVSDLLSSTGIRNAEQVVVSGGSAGASAVFWHVDQIARQLQLRDGEVVAVPDAGLFLDVSDLSGTSCWPAQMRSLSEIANVYSSLNEKCLARFPGKEWTCLFPQYYLDVMETRTFVINSLYDSSELTYSLGLTCCPGDCHGRSKKCSRNEMSSFETLRAGHVQAVAALTRRPNFGAWMPACVEHTLTWGRWTDASWSVPAGRGNTMAVTVQNWLEKRDVDGRDFNYIDDVSWPKNRPCSEA